MEISAFSPASIWNNATRTLTGFGTSLVNVSVAQTTIAAAASVDFRPGAGFFNLATFFIKTGATATVTVSIQMYDGTNAYNMVTSAAGANQGTQFHMMSTVTSGCRLINNDGAIAGQYIAAIMRFAT